jgi:archaellum component FlaC
MLANAEEAEDIPVSSENAQNWVGQLETHADRIFAQRANELEAEENSLLEQRRAQIRARAEREIRQQESRRTTIEERLRRAEQEGDKRAAQNFRNFIQGVHTNIEKIKALANVQNQKIPDTVSVQHPWALKSIGLVSVQE